MTGPPLLIVLRLVGGRHEGQWREVDRAPIISRPTAPAPDDAVALVATGCVEWSDDGRCAEVFVPRDLLWLWRAEHDLEHR